MLVHRHCCQQHTVNAQLVAEDTASFLCFACVCAVAVLVEFHAFVGIKKHRRRCSKLQSLNAAYSDRFVTMAQSLHMASGYDQMFSRVVVTLAY